MRSPLGLRDQILRIDPPALSQRALWPPADPSDYSLIVNGVGSLRHDELTVTPIRAVLHRPATTIGGGCESDRVELPVAASSG